jgi:uncharacterized membrane protein
LKLPDPSAANRRARAFELDALRGLALFMMFLHHLIFDLRYIYLLDVFAMQETWWFEHLLRPAFLNVFLIVSGICCTFSRSNTRRGLRLLLVAVGFTIASTAISEIANIDLYIFFNVLHLLAVGTLLYAALTARENARAQSQINGHGLLPGMDNRVDVVLLLLAGFLLWAGDMLPDLTNMGFGSWLTLPFGILPNLPMTMGDYLPIIPWLGFFLIGALIGRRLYANRQTAFPGAPDWLRTASKPFEFLGRNSLVFYALHQPLFIGVLSGLRALGWI